MLGTAAPSDRQRTDSSPPDLSPSARALLGAALVAVFIAALDLTVITTILTRIIFDLGINVGEIERYSWIVSGYLLAYLITIPIAGRVSDLIGRRPVFLCALGLFVFGSIGCVLAQGLVPLILARAVQGLGGGALVPVTLALAADLLPPGRRAAVIGAIGAIDTLGWVLGPLWGAGVVNLLGVARIGLVRDWRWVFALNVPIALAVLATIFIAWRRSARIERRAPGRFDWLGALTLTVALACLNLAVSSGTEAGGGPRALGAGPNPLAPYRLPLLVGAVVAFALFVVIVRRAPWPILPLGLFRRPIFSAANLANLLVGAALIVVMVDVPFVVSLLATDANRAGLISALLLLPFTLAMAAGSLSGGTICERAGYRTVALGGLLIAATGFWRLWGWPDSLAYGRMAIDLVICGLGLGLVIAPVGAAAINSVQEGDYGIASSLVLVMRLLGMTLGLSALTAWGAGQLDTLVRALPTLTQRADETPIAYLTRQTEYQGQQVLVLTLHILHQTFAIAGVLCLLALLPAGLLSGHGRRETTSGEPFGTAR